MRKKIIIISVFLLILLFKPINTYAETKNPIHLSQGIYTIKDIGLMTNVNYKINNISEGKSVIMIIDSEQKIQELLRLDPNSPKYILKPLNFTDLIVIIGSATLELSYTT
ncbi:hypothetical protein [Inconstantimicrobium mannanitabidum]|uniref:Uncharacterized protein n=1 Tax=Inconstantimicrobium mannanitabidum TaxID=1604901 RepID=A0ACB5RIR9_9CLOT|nr:hypothetical protein [Clostridium sp. TW13]GKX68985.1 hypothetical protein rsdtw13_42430 [Clostridium sp. TW13]